MVVQCFKLMSQVVQMTIRMVQKLILNHDFVQHDGVAENKSNQQKLEHANKTGFSAKEKAPDSFSVRPAG